MGSIEKATDIISSVSSNTRRAILFYSCGKDSLALLDLIYPHFDEVICVFMYFVPDLDHVNRYLNWAKTRYPKIKIEQIPHWNLTYILRKGIYCVPNYKQKLFKIAEIDSSMRLKYGTDYTFYGMKKADSLNRRLMLNTYTNGQNNGKVYPLTDWTNKEVMAYIKAKKIPEPVRYSKNASGGVGFNIECFLYLREHFPQDLKKILAAFPLSEIILINHDNNQPK